MTDAELRNEKLKSLTILNDASIDRLAEQIAQRVFAKALDFFFNTPFVHQDHVTEFECPDGRRIVHDHLRGTVSMYDTDGATLLSESTIRRHS